jgi:hypothetical protein
MIKPTELRIGNKVLYSDIPISFVDGKIGTVQIIDGHNGCVWLEEDNENPYGMDNISGLPLTPELFEKCGFGKGGRRIDEYGLLKITPDGRYEIVEFTDAETYRSYDNRVQYLHQLQNLFCALADGFDLEVKL